MNWTTTDARLVSKRRLQQSLADSPEPAVDVQLLLLAFKLLGSNDRSEASSLYTRCKQCLLVIESTGSLSARLLQASILIALYELANAIYPAAYLSIGHCARLGHAMGIHDRRNATQMLSTPGTRPTIRPWSLCNTLR